MSQIVQDDSEGLNLTKDSRMFYVLGKETMIRMKQTNVLIIGLRGLGIELGLCWRYSVGSLTSIAKNVILAGVRSVAIHDDSPVAIEDLSSQV